MKNTILKLLLFFVLLNCTFPKLYCQKLAPFLKNEVYFIGYVEFDSLIKVYPYGSELCNSGCFCIEKRNLDKFNQNYPKDKDYFLLYYDAFNIFSDSPRIYQYILPNVNDSISKIIKKNYPKEWVGEPYGYSELIFIENFRYRDIYQKKFLLFLVHVELFNHMKTHWRPICKIFENEKTIKGLYIKLLIPVFE